MAPEAYEAAVKTGPAGVTVMVSDVPGDEFLDVVTAKVKLPVEAGALAVKSTCAAVPWAREHVLCRSTVIPVALYPPPLVPAWTHELPTRAMLDGVDPRDVDGATLTQSELPPASAVPTVKLTSNPVDALVLTPLGEAVTPVTAPDGEPMVYALVVISA